MVSLELVEGILTKLARFNDFSRFLLTLASAVGLLVLIGQAISLTITLIQALRLYVISQFCCQKSLIKKYGQWAVITGSTDGIGLAMAKELAHRGMSIIVVGRNADKLARTRAMLQEEPNVGQVETVRIDLSVSSPENFNSIRRKIDPDNRDIGILINNAGTCPIKFQHILDYDTKSLTNLVNLNCIAPVSLTCMIMPAMVRRGKGLVINVSSLMGCIPSPYMSTYGPSKAFLESFTRQLQYEYSSHPMDIILLTPGPVKTRLWIASSKARLLKTSVFTHDMVPSAEQYARTAINAISAGVQTYSGTVVHGLALWSSIQIYHLGLVEVAYRIVCRISPPHWELSPFPKRK